jgi:hypothetical protein
MHGWLSIVVIILAGLTALYVLKMDGLRSGELRGWEGFADFIESGSGSLESGGIPEQPLAAVDQGVLLSDMMTVQTGLSGYSAGDCASVDKTRELELDGQYIQRTNNYKRDYPDNCSAPLSELVGSVYKPKDGVGMTVPCGGQC